MSCSVKKLVKEGRCTPACPWEVWNEFLILLCLLNCFYLNSWVFFTLTLLIPPILLGASKQRGRDVILKDNTDRVTPLSNQLGIICTLPKCTYTVI